MTVRHHAPHGFAYVICPSDARPCFCVQPASRSPHTQFADTCGWSGVVVAELGWPLSTWKFGEDRQFIRDPSGVTGEFQDKLAVGVDLPPGARDTRVSQWRGLSSGCHRQIQTRHTYGLEMTSKDGRALIPRRLPLVARQAYSRTCYDLRTATRSRT